MPQQNEPHSFSSKLFVSDIDYSEAQNMLDLTSTKQKQLRRQRAPALHRQVLLNRTYTLVCELLDSDCSYSSHQVPERASPPLSAVDTNKRKAPADADTEASSSSVAKKSKSLMDKCYDITNDDDVLQFLRELNSVKLTASDVDERRWAVVIVVV